MIRLGTWKQNPSFPGGFASGGACTASGWVISRGTQLLPTSRNMVQRARLLGDGVLGAWEEVQTVYGMVNGGAGAALPFEMPDGKVVLGYFTNGLETPEEFRSGAAILDPLSGVVRPGQRGLGILTGNWLHLGGGIIGGVTSTTNPGVYVPGTPWVAGGDVEERTPCSPRVLTENLDVFDTNNTSFRACLVLHGQVWMLCGYRTTGLAPYVTIRAAPISNGIIGPGWRTMGVLPVVNGINRVQPVVWRDYLIIAGGGIDPAVSTSGSSTIWAVKTSRDGLVGSWQQVGELPTALRSHQTVIDDQGYLHILGGIPNGVAATYENACYSVKLED